MASTCAPTPPERPLKTELDYGDLIDELIYAHADCRAHVAAWQQWWTRVKTEAAK